MGGTCYFFAFLIYSAFNSDCVGIYTTALHSLRKKRPKFERRNLQVIVTQQLIRELAETIIPNDQW